MTMTKNHFTDKKMLKAAIGEVVENQLRDGNPPETRQTYARLLAAGYSDKEARQLIGYVVMSEIFEVLKNNEPYNQNRYVTALKRLPKLPGE